MLSFILIILLSIAIIFGLPIVIIYLLSITVEKDKYIMNLHKGRENHVIDSNFSETEEI